MEVQIAEDLSSILSFVILAIAIITAWVILGRKRRLWERKTQKLEAFLRAAATDAGHTARSVLQITEQVGLTGDEAAQISFDNPRIGRRITGGELTYFWTGDSAS